MSGTSHRRRLKRLEGGGGSDFLELYVEAVTAVSEMRERQIGAVRGLTGLARELVGPIEPSPQPPRDPGEEFPELRKRELPPSQAREVWYDPRRGGVTFTRFGGLGSSADALKAMPPPEPVADPRPRKPRVNPWGLVVPAHATPETKAWARSMGWLPFDEIPIEDDEDDEASR